MPTGKTVKKKTPTVNDDFVQAMLDDDVLPLKTPLRHQKPISPKKLKKTPEAFQRLPVLLTAEPADVFSVIKPGSDNRLLKTLKKTSAFDSTIDLHGLNRYEAVNYLRQEINHYVKKSATLKIIHGKSAAPDSLPILKSITKSLLTEHPRVIAFCSAPLNKGGTGVTLALLQP